jgi:PEP-CTERM motif
MRAVLRPALLAASTLATLGSAQALTVYDDDFDNPPVVAAGVIATFNPAGGGTIATASPYNTTWGNVFRNSTTGQATLLLGNLPAHTAIDIDFAALFLDSWDSSNGSPAPDWFNVYIDNVLVAQLTANNASGNVNQFGGGTVVAQYVQFDVNFFYSDTVVDMTGDATYSFAHSSPGIVIGFEAGGAGWQGGSDEALGLGFLTVSVTPVPEPAPAALLLAGLGAIGWLARRRR